MASPRGPGGRKSYGIRSAIQGYQQTHAARQAIHLASPTTNLARRTIRLASRMPGLAVQATGNAIQAARMASPVVRMARQAMGAARYDAHHRRALGHLRTHVLVLSLLCFVIILARWDISLDRFVQDFTGEGP
uniref:Uncharacterized protein n=1 Tax=Candidatus Kentrum sp. SD TaxID=2126332 RepID=A0A450Z4T2_9GAMM|nr:MAG: hypothetical protein BECKSD772F_GA0070984_11422 [Candidatus Kentron sp. SD]VFK48688.1 MAG: hypothetical protein BECKSD772E_GA0070983_11364 [Candidatus Kentron sp. SD]